MESTTAATGGGGAGQGRPKPPHQRRGNSNPRPSSQQQPRSSEPEDPKPRLESAEEFQRRRQQPQQQGQQAGQPGGAGNQQRNFQQRSNGGRPSGGSNVNQTGAVRGAEHSTRQPQQQQARQPPRVQQQQQQQQQPRQQQKQQSQGGEGETSTAIKKTRTKRQKRDQAASGSQEGDSMMVEEGEEGIVEKASTGGPKKSTATSTVHLSETTFESLGDISLSARKALKEHLKFERMTIVQEATLPAIASGKDVLAKAKTGTGKTIAFLLHVLDRLAARPSRGDPSATSVLILSPTRELACQIEQEAKDLLFFQPKGKVEVAVMYGGYQVTKDLRRFNERPIDVLVATPGRLEDHLKNAPGVKDRLAKGCQVLILDEADQLLEMGFRPAIERIINVLPKSRQTLLFTATVPQQMHQVALLAMKREHEFVDCVGETEEQTNAMVKQEYCLVPIENQLAALDLVIHNHIAQNKQKYKIIVFFATARAAGYAAAMFEQSGMPGVLAIHSRKSQAQRTKASDAFKNGNKLVLFSSDVSARGLDYPDVSLVVQVGVVEREQYIHRVGRTARAGASGQGLLILAPFEQFMLKTIADLPITQVPSEMAAQLAEAQPSARIQGALQEVSKRGTELNLAAQQAYQAWLGFYKGQLSKMRKTPVELVKMANDYAGVMGLKEIPALQRKTVGMMGLKGVPGLRIE